MNDAGGRGPLISLPAGLPAEVSIDFKRLCYNKSLIELLKISLYSRSGRQGERVRNKNKMRKKFLSQIFIFLKNKL